MRRFISLHETKKQRLISSNETLFVVFYLLFGCVILKHQQQLCPAVDPKLPV